MRAGKFRFIFRQMGEVCGIIYDNGAVVSICGKLESMIFYKKAGLGSTNTQFYIPEPQRLN